MLDAKGLLEWVDVQVSIIIYYLFIYLFTCLIHID